MDRGFVTMGTNIHPKTELVNGVMEEEASEILKRFFIQKRNLN